MTRKAKNNAENWKFLEERHYSDSIEGWQLFHKKCLSQIRGWCDDLHGMDHFSLMQATLAFIKVKSGTFYPTKGKRPSWKNGTQQNVGILSLDVFLSDQIDDKWFLKHVTCKTGLQCCWPTTNSKPLKMCFLKAAKHQHIKLKDFHTDLAQYGKSQSLAIFE